MKTRLSRFDAEVLAAKLLELKLHPSVIRRRLAEHGVHWDYQFIGQGTKERLRRLRAAGLGLCATCKTNSYKLGSAVNMCPGCLDTKWREPGTGIPIGDRLPTLPR